MSKVILLEQLKVFTEEVTRGLLSPVAQQKGDELPPPPRAPDVYCARLPDSRAAKKKAPYILHQVVTGKDVQAAGERLDSTASVRSIFCVYHHDGQEGGLALLNLMEQLRIALLERVIIGSMYRLDLREGLEALVYPENDAPYFAGEMFSVWHLPPVTRLDAARTVHGMPPWDPHPRHLKETVKWKGIDENGEENDRHQPDSAPGHC